MIYTIGGDLLTVAVNTLGAELISVKHLGKERLWQNENGGWAGHAPVLFPYAGRCTVKVDGVKYPSQMHGVACSQEFEVVEKTDDSVTLVLRDNEETRAQYPFAFSFFVTYTVAANCLKVRYAVENTGERTLPFALGMHESYALDNEVMHHFIEFERVEDYDTWLVNPDTGKLTGEVKSLGRHKNFWLPQEFMEDNTVVFKGVQSNFLYLKNNRNECLATLSFPGFSNVLLWHPKGSNMVCIEPWQNLPDDDGKEPIEFSQKAGVTNLAKGERAEFTHEIRYF